MFGGKYNCVNPCKTRVIPERFGGAIKCYTNRRLLYFTLVYEMKSKGPRTKPRKTPYIKMRK